MANKAIVSAEHTGLKLTIYGYCGLDHGRIADLIYQRKIYELKTLEGEYTIVYEIDNHVGIVTSLIGAIQYFYYFDGLTFKHGENIIDIAKASSIKWQWDWESIGDLCELENLTADRTLHESIKRVPPGSYLTFDGKLRISTTNFIDTISQRVTSPLDAIKILNRQTQKWSTANPYISLSGGFDSRVILSSMLHQEIYPNVVTVGTNASSDSQVARAIANKFSLNYNQVQITLDDFLDNAEHISYITNGAKPACHWHTYLYPKKAGVPYNESFFVGTLGEFARNYYCDLGIISFLSASLGDHAKHQFWKQKISRHRTFNSDEEKFLSPLLQKQISREGQNIRAKRNTNLVRGTFLESLTRYYFEQRVPNFYANGIRMYNDTTLWRSPFHCKEWCEVIWNLNNYWKLGSNWHRLAIQRNCVSLLDFPEEKGFFTKKMAPKATPLYWSPYMQRLKYKSYDLSSDWYCSKEIRELLMDSKDELSEFMDPMLCDKLLEQQVSGGNRTRSISFILTLLYFKFTLQKNGLV